MRPPADARCVVAIVEDDLYYQKAHERWFGEFAEEGLLDGLCPNQAIVFEKFKDDREFAAWYAKEGNSLQLIILDWKLVWGRSGEGVLETVRNHSLPIGILLQTSVNQSEIQEAISRVWPDGSPPHPFVYLPKSFLPPERVHPTKILRRILGELLAKVEERRQAMGRAAG